MIQMIRKIRALFCRHRWQAPNIAFFNSQRNNTFPLKCAKCGTREPRTGKEIQEMREKARKQ